MSSGHGIPALLFIHINQTGNGFCRKRKIVSSAILLGRFPNTLTIQKCDANRPMCSQCASGNLRPGDLCEYADGGRTHTQLLEDNIAKLEARIRELEEPADENAVRLHLPYSTSSHQSSDAMLVPLATPSPQSRTSQVLVVSPPLLRSIIDPPRSSHSSSTASSPGRSLSATPSALHEVSLVNLMIIA